MPEWRISLVGGLPEQAVTCDAICNIKDIYSRDALDADFLPFVEHFAGWIVSEYRRGRSPEDVAGSLPRYIENVIQGGLADRAFLKAEAFRVILTGLNDPEEGEGSRQWPWAFVEYAV